jgi:hypothetical protein
VIYNFLADLLVALHLGYVAFVVVGQLLIVVGLICRWQWVRNPWFRALHLLAITIVAAETIIGLNCPLTDWEDQLRQLANRPIEQGTFIGRLMHNLFRFDNLPYDHWAFRASYIGFAVLVLATFFLAPPRLRRRQRADACGSPLNEETMNGESQTPALAASVEQLP